MPEDAKIPEATSFIQKPLSAADAESITPSDLSARPPADSDCGARVGEPTADELEKLWEKIVGSFISTATNAVLPPNLREDINLLFYKHHDFWQKIIAEYEEKNPDLGMVEKAAVVKAMIEYCNKNKTWIASIKEVKKYGKNNKESLGLNTDLQPNNFYFSNGDKQQNRNKLFLIIRSTNHNQATSTNDLIIINPCYQPASPKTQSSQKDYTRELRNDLAKLLSVGEDEPEEFDLGFEVKIIFSKFGERGGKVNYDIPEPLRNDSYGFSVPVAISSGNDKDISITLGKANEKISFSFPRGKRQTSISLQEGKDTGYNFWTKDRPFPDVQFNNLNDRSKSNIGEIWFPVAAGEQRREFLPDITILKVDNSKTPLNQTQLDTLKDVLLDSWMQFNSDGKPVSPDIDGKYNDLGRVLATCLCVAILYDIDRASDDPPSSGVFDPKLPKADVHRPTRQVDLRPFKLKEQLEKREQLYYSTPALNSLAMALNSGDHVILTGPPGSGKTELAKKIPKLIIKKHLLCTASPDWTTNELIGRYMPVPEKDNNAVLEFEPGFFLQAIDSGAWLIIDELNRADIDSCMGPLFSVLSGHRAYLPYKTNKRTQEEVAEDESNDNPEEASKNSAPDAAAPEKGSEVGLPTTPPNPGTPTLHVAPQSDCSRDPNMKDGARNWRQIGICLEGDDGPRDANTYWYEVPEDFRIICTMNDSDAGMLNQLSYALQRRFSVIRVEAPDAEKVKEFIDNKVDKIYKVYQDPKDEDTQTKVNNKTDSKGMVKYLCRNVPHKHEEDDLKILLKELFSKSKAEDKFDRDLMQLRIVGFGQVKDIIKMVVEGFSCSKSYTFNVNEDERKIKELIRTLLANGVVTKVFPQLPAFICNRDEDEIGETFLPALMCIAKVFVNHNYYELAVSDNKLIPEEQLPSNNLLDNYLEKELKLLFRNQHVDWKPHWDAAKFYADAVNVPETEKTGKKFKDLRDKYRIPESPTIASIKDVVDFLRDKFNKPEPDGGGEPPPKDE